MKKDAPPRIACMVCQMGPAYRGMLVCKACSTRIWSLGVNPRRIKILPFLERFHDQVRKGTKDLTARTHKYGNPGDLLIGPRCLLRLDQVVKVQLHVVAGLLYGREGASSKEDFVNVWKEIHPRAGYDPAQKVWVHQFEVIDV